MKAWVAWACPEAQDLVEVDLPVAATVADAVARSRLLVAYGLNPSELVYAVFGRRVHPQAALADGDRVELTRPLTADPKDLRRRRARLRK